VSRATALVSAIALTAVLVVVGLLLPVPYVVLSPGLTLNTLGRLPGGHQPLIAVSGSHVRGARGRHAGRLIMLTVYLTGGPGAQPSLFQAVRGWLNGQDAVLPQALEFPPQVSSKQVTAQNTDEMLQSQRDAVTAALSQLGIPGEVVVEAPADTPGGRLLRAGDVLEAINGVRVDRLAQSLRLIRKVRAPRRVTLSILRRGRPLTLRVPTVREDGRTVVGFIPEVRPRPPLSVRIQLSASLVGGPSAGMMFALGIIDKLTPGGITGGRAIAGTGTIDFAGDVGEIGGIQQKVFAAADAGASVFLAPTGECPAARAVAPLGLRVVPVSTLSAAVAALRDLRTGHRLPSC
jgi:PDZ domain-containing protein